MLSAWVYGDGDPREIDPPDISDYVAEEARLIWVDVSNPDDADLQCLQEEFSLHPLAVEDVHHRFQRPKLEKYPTHSFLVVYTSTLQEIDIFVGPNWIISVREHEQAGQPWSVDSARSRFERTHPDPPTPGFLVYVLLDELVDGYFDAIDRAEDSLEQLEERIFSEELQDEHAVQRDLFDARRRLVQFRRTIVPVRDVVGALMRGEVQWIDKETVIFLQDVYDHVLRAVDSIDAQRELMGNAVDAHYAIISNHMNSVMKKMTSWGAILLVATLVASFYGMNFRYFPSIEWRFGLLWAVGLMLAITMAGYVYFKRKDWL